MLRVLVFKFNSFQENCYVVYNESINTEEKKCVIVDPGFVVNGEKNALYRKLNEFGLKIEPVLLTHLHFDHIGGVSSIIEDYGVPVFLSSKDKYLTDFCSETPKFLGFDSIDVSFPTVDVQDGDILNIANMSIKCIATPGHSAEGFCYLIEDKLFSGDTLFEGAIGRSDLPGGEYDDLIRSIMEKLMLLDSDITVYPGHGPSTNIGYERMNNPFLEPFNEEDFDIQ